MYRDDLAAALARVSVLEREVRDLQAKQAAEPAVPEIVIKSSWIRDSTIVFVLAVGQLLVGFLLGGAFAADLASLR